MVRAAIIEDGKVVNIAVVNSLGDIPGAIEALDAAIGDLWDGSTFTKPAPPVPTVKEYTDAVQAHLDAKAQEKHYDDIVSACSYAGAPNPFQAEGQAFIAWRGNVWAKCYEVMAQVQAGTMAPPTIADLIAMLPGITL